MGVSRKKYNRTLNKKSLKKNSRKIYNKNKRKISQRKTNKSKISQRKTNKRKKSKNKTKRKKNFLKKTMKGGGRGLNNLNSTGKKTLLYGSTRLTKRIFELDDEQHYENYFKEGIENALFEIKNKVLTWGDEPNLQPIHKEPTSKDIENIQEILKYYRRELFMKKYIENRIISNNYLDSQFLGFTLILLIYIKFIKEEHLDIDELQKLKPIKLLEKLCEIIPRTR